MKKYTVSNTYEILLYTFIFLLPWHTIWIVQDIFYQGEKWQYGTVGIYISDIVLCIWLTISTYMYHAQIRSYILSHKTLFFASILLCLWSFLSITWSLNTSIALYASFKLATCIYTLFILRTSPINRRAVAMIFLASMLCHSLIGLYQFFTQETFASTLLGLQHHTIWHGSTATITADSERWLRIYSGFPHPNIFGGMLFLSLIINIWLFVKRQKNSSLYTLFSFSCTALFTTNILLTFSRSTWVATAISLLCFYIIMRAQKITQEQKAFLKQACLIFCTITVITVSFWHIFSTRTHHTNTTHNSFSDRKAYVHHAQKIIKRHFFSGTGIGNYTNTVAHMHAYEKPLWYYQPVHNTFILLFAEIGFIGCALFVFFISVLLYHLWCSQHAILLDRWVPFIILIGLCVISFFDHWLWTSHVGIVTFFVLYGVLGQEKSDASPL